MSPYVTLALQNTHEQLKKAKVEYFNSKEKMINCCLVVVSFEKYKCGIKVYGAIGLLNETDTSIFCSDNRKEICSLFGL